MPSEQFSKPKQEFTSKEMEGLIKIQLDPSITMADIHDQITSYKWIQFVLTEEYNLMMSTAPHERMTIRAGINRDSCMVPEGSFKIQNGKLRFHYYFLQTLPARAKYVEATENVIKKWLTSKGVEFK